MNCSRLRHGQGWPSQPTADCSLLLTHRTVMWLCMNPDPKAEKGQKSTLNTPGVLLLCICLAVVTSSLTEVTWGSRCLWRLTIKKENPSSWPGRTAAGEQESPSHGVHRPWRRERWVLELLPLASPLPFSLRPSSMERCYSEDGSSLFYKAHRETPSHAGCLLSDSPVQLAIRLASTVPNHHHYP